MPNNDRKQMLQFMHETLHGATTNMLKYSDDKFCQKLQMFALTDLQFLLLRIHHEHMRAKQLNRPYDLTTALNRVHPETKFNVLDYCIAAGLDDLAVKLLFLGARSANVPTVIENINKYYSGSMELPNIVVQIQNICTQADLEQKHSTDLLIQHTLASRTLEALKGLAQDYRFGLALVIIGLVCSFVIPITIPVGIGVGLIIGGIIPTVLGGVNEVKKYQANLQQSQIVEQNNLYVQKDQALRDILNTISSQKHELKHEVELTRHMTDASYESPRVIDKKITQTELESMLYEFLKHAEENNKDKERNSTPADPKSRTIS